MKYKNPKDISLNIPKKKFLSFQTIYPISVLSIFVLGIVIWFGILLTKEKELLNTIHSDPRNGKAFENLAEFYWQTPWRNRVTPIFEELLKQYPDNPWPPLILAADDYTYPVISEKTETYFEESVRLANQDEGALDAVARFYLRANKFQEVNYVTSQIIENNPNASEAYFMLGQALKRTGREETARENFRKSVDTGSLDNTWVQKSVAELITASRFITITFESNLVLSSQIVISNPSLQIRDSFAQLSHSQREISSLIWGEAFFVEEMQKFRLSSGKPDISLSSDEIIITQKETTIPYHIVYRWSNFHPFAANPFSIGNLPMVSHANPITLTVIANPTYISDFSSPPDKVEGDQFSWIITNTSQISPSVSFSISPELFGIETYIFSNYALSLLVWYTPWALTVLITIVVFFRARSRCNRTGTAQVQQLYVGKTWQELFGYDRPLSWIFDFSLIVISFFSFILPLILFFINSEIYFTQLEYYVYVLLLGVLLLRLITLPSFFDPNMNQSLIEIGGVVFVFYLIIRVVPYSMNMLAIIFGVIAYKFILVRDHKWMTNLNSTFLKDKVDRANITEQISSLHALPSLRDGLRNLDFKFAKNEVKHTDYQETKNLFEQLILQKENLRNELRIKLTPPENKDVDEIILSVGPSLSPLDNAIVAVTFGLLPYIAFLILDWKYGATWSYLSGGLTIDAVYSFLFSLITMPWGPIYIFFFGYFYQVLWGKRGVTKGIIFSGVLILIFVPFEWLASWRDINEIEVLGEILRILTTFTIVGIAMDFSAVNLSWRRFRAFYNSPVFATIIAIFVTTITTVVTASISGSLNDLLSVVISQLTVGNAGTGN